MRFSKLWVESDGSFEHQTCFSVCLRRLQEQRPPPHAKIIGLQICGFLALRNLLRLKSADESLDDLGGDLVLDFEYIVQATVEPFGPQMTAADRIYQLHIAPHPSRGPPSASLQNIAHPEIASDAADINGFSLVSK